MSRTAVIEAVEKFRYALDRLEDAENSRKDAMNAMHFYAGELAKVCDSCSKCSAVDIRFPSPSKPVDNIRSVR